MALPPQEIAKRLRALREEVGVSIDELATACGITPAAYSKLEAGTMDLISGDYVLIAARILKTDFRYFISDALDELEKETRQVFRALDAPSPADRLAIRRFMLFCLGEAELEELLSQGRPQLPPTYPRPHATDYLHKDQGKRAASQERERLSLGNLPIQNVFDIIRRQGVRLSRHALTDASLSGLTVIHPKRQCLYSD